MKSINQYINEKLKLKNVKKQIYNYHPKTKEELKDLIKQLIKERGNEGDFNDIDTSEIKDMSYLFFDMAHFNGDISRWDVSNAISMESMFFQSYFNKDISNWDVSNVVNMKGMFSQCSFN
jgi:surface protein